MPIRVIEFNPGETKPWPDEEGYWALWHPKAGWYHTLHMAKMRDGQMCLLLGDSWVSRESYLYTRHDGTCLVAGPFVLAARE